MMNDPTMESICVGDHHTYIDEKPVIYYEWYLYRHEGRIWMRTIRYGVIVTQRPYDLTEEEMEKMFALHNSTNHTQGIQDAIDILNKD